MSESSTTIRHAAPAPPAGLDYTRRAFLALAVAVVLAAGLVPLDGDIAAFCTRFQKGGAWALGGDLRRSLEFLQQFGDLASSLIAGLCILLLDPANRRRVFDWIVAALATSLGVLVLKMLLGRARPHLAEGDRAHAALNFTWPWMTRPLPAKDALGEAITIERHAWEFWNRVSDLWSMPSSHTSAAMVLAVVLHTFYPRLGPLVWPLVAVVAVARVLFGAHFPSDVVLGAGVGYAVATLAVRGSWGRRLAAHAAPGYHRSLA